MKHLITEYNKFLMDTVLGNKILRVIDKGIEKSAPVLRPIVRATSTTFKPGKMYKTIKRKFEEIKNTFDWNNMRLEGNLNDRDTKYLIYADEDEIKLDINMFGIHVITYNGVDITEELNPWLLNDIYDYLIWRWQVGDVNKIAGQIFAAYDPYGEENWDD